MVKSEAAKQANKRYYELTKKDQIEEVRKRFQEKYPELTIPEEEEKPGFSVERYKKKLVKLVLGEVDVFELMMSDKISKQ